ncbi:MAG: hypothetical protein KC912_12320 [Proteobacteria bacterium]|nr:hypothetical protein [Pseudomonadota bacterium]
MRFLFFALLLSACSEYEIVGPDGQNAFPLEDGPNINVDEDVALSKVYAHTSTSLYDVDPETGVTAFLANFHDASGTVEGFVDIAIDLDGYLWGGTFDDLYKIEPRSGLVTRVCSLDIQPYAMTFGPNGVLYAGGNDSRIVEVNTSNCSTSLLVDSSYTTSGDLVGLPDGFLYWTVRSSGASGNSEKDELVQVDPDNGDTRWMGIIDADGLYGVGYADERLYGFSSDGKIVAINPANAQTELLQTSDSISWWGATTNPVRW